MPSRWRVAEAVLKIGRDRDIHRGHDLDRVGERLVSRDRSVKATERRREAAAGRGQSLETHGDKHSRRARVPRVGHHERRTGPVQGREMLGPGLAHEAADSWSVAGCQAREATARAFQALMVTIRPSRAPISSALR